MAEKGRSSGPGRSGNKSDRGGSGTLGAGSDFNVQGPARGFRDGGRDEGGNKIGAVEGGGGLLGGFFNPGRMVGAGIGSLIAGPIGGLLGGFIGGGMGRQGQGQRQGWGYVDAQGNRVSAGRDMIDGGGRGRSGDRFEGGGLLSAAGNALGIRPAGYRDRQAMQSQMFADQVRAGIGSAGGIPPVGVTDLTGTSASVAPVSQPVTPQAMGQTMRPGLTATDLARLQAMGLGQGALVGEEPTAQEMAALMRGPGMLPGVNPPNVFAPFAPSSPAMDAVFQGTPGVNVGLSDIGTTLPHVSRVPPAMPGAGSMPYADTQSYRAGMAPAAMSQPPMGGQYAGLLSGPGMVPGVDVGAPARTAPSMYQPNPITSTRGAGTVPATSPALPPSPYGGQSFDPAAVRAATQAQLERLAAERANRGNTIRREYFTPLQ